MLISHGLQGEKWCVIHTRTRQEKKLYEWCRGLGLMAYIPLINRPHRRFRGRREETPMPLFTGYLFCCMKRENRREVYKGGNIVRILEVVDQDGLLRDLNQIEKAIRLEATLEPYSYLKRGRRVRIVDGPFEGLEGIISQRRGKCRLVLNVNFIEMAGAIEVDMSQVEPVDTSHRKAGYR